MKKLVLTLSCAAVLLLQPAGALPQEQKPLNHGGKIETKYDGFNHETILRLKKMKVSCDGFKDNFKNACISIEVTLHCPGIQINYVREVTLQVFFENQDWVPLHSPDQRALSVVIDTETVRLGTMVPVSGKAGTWHNKIEALEARISYAAFKKLAMSRMAAIQVGPDSVELRDNNIAALKDLSNRVLTAESKSVSASPR